MDRNIITEINRIREVMGVKPLLLETALFRALIKKFGKGVTLTFDELLGIANAKPGLIDDLIERGLIGGGVTKITKETFDGLDKVTRKKVLTKMFMEVDELRDLIVKQAETMVGDGSKLADINNIKNLMNDLNTNFTTKLDLEDMARLSDDLFGESGNIMSKTINNVLEKAAKEASDLANKTTRKIKYGENLFKEAGTSTGGPKRNIIEDVISYNSKTVDGAAKYMDELRGYGLSEEAAGAVNSKYLGDIDFVPKEYVDELWDAMKKNPNQAEKDLINIISKDDVVIDLVTNSKLDSSTLGTKLGFDEKFMDDVIETVNKNSEGVIEKFNKSRFGKFTNKSYKLIKTLVCKIPPFNYMCGTTIFKHSTVKVALFVNYLIGVAINSDLMDLVNVITESPGKIITFFSSNTWLTLTDSSQNKFGMDDVKLSAIASSINIKLRGDRSNSPQLKAALDSTDTTLLVTMINEWKKDNLPVGQSEDHEKWSKETWNQFIDDNESNWGVFNSVFNTAITVGTNISEELVFEELMRVNSIIQGAQLSTHYHKTYGVELWRDMNRLEMGGGDWKDFIFGSIWKYSVMSATHLPDTKRSDIYPEISALPWGVINGLSAEDGTVEQFTDFKDEIVKSIPNFPTKLLNGKSRNGQYWYSRKRGKLDNLINFEVAFDKQSNYEDFQTYIDNLSAQEFNKHYESDVFVNFKVKTKDLIDVDVTDAVESDAEKLSQQIKKLTSKFGLSIDDVDSEILKLATGKL